MEGSRCQDLQMTKGRLFFYYCFRPLTSLLPTSFVIKRVKAFCMYIIPPIRHFGSLKVTTRTDKEN